MITGLAAVSAVAACAVGVDALVPRAAAADAAGTAPPAHLERSLAATQPAVLPEATKPATAAPGAVVAGGAGLAPAAVGAGPPAAGIVPLSAVADSRGRRLAGGVRARAPPG
jgi:hypothetical protein